MKHSMKVLLVGKRVGLLIILEECTQQSLLLSNTRGETLMLHPPELLTCGECLLVNGDNSCLPSRYSQECCRSKQNIGALSSSLLLRMNQTWKLFIWFKVIHTYESPGALGLRIGSLTFLVSRLIVCRIYVAERWNRVLLIADLLGWVNLWLTYLYVFFEIIIHIGKQPERGEKRVIYIPERTSNNAENWIVEKPGRWMACSSHVCLPRPDLITRMS